MDVYKKAWKLLEKKLEKEKPPGADEFERLMSGCLIQVRSEIVGSGGDS